MNLILIFGDQLSENISCLSNVDKENDIILMCEVYEEATYVKHHKKKIAFIFSAMRHFAQYLNKKGFNLRYVKYDDPENSRSLFGEVERATSKQNFEKVILTEPNEYRLTSDLKTWSERLGLLVEVLEDDRFLCSHSEFNRWASNRKQLRMEFFYREMRRKYSILMDGGEPEGGQWNFDRENRSPPKEGLEIPETYVSEPNGITQEVLDLVENRFPDHFGELKHFHFAVTREQAMEALDQFISKRLSYFW